MTYIDLSQPIQNGMPVYPGDSAVKLDQSKIYSIDYYNNHTITAGMHIGTHIDGRMHLLDVREYIGNMPPEHFCGKGGIIHAENESVIKMKESYLEIIRDKKVILFHTGMDKFYGSEKYYSEHPILDMTVCKALAESNVSLIGVDMPSPDRFPFEIHKFLLNHNIFIIENLTNLDKLSSAMEFEVFAFPLKIDADSSPLRVVARVFD